MVSWTVFKVKKGVTSVRSFYLTGKGMSPSYESHNRF